MRIIKLSDKDPDMSDREAVDDYFLQQLPGRNGGRFYFPKNCIDKNGLIAGEHLVFSYNMEIVYVAFTKSGRLDTTDENKEECPYHFEVNLDSIREASGGLRDLEVKLETLGLLDLAGKTWT